MQFALKKQDQPIKEVKPICPIFGQCGGCHYQNIPYKEELKIKEVCLKEILGECNDISNDKFAPIISSPKSYHYRNRLDLKLKHTRNDDVFIGFTPFDNKGVIPVDTCSIAEQKISDFIPELKRQAIRMLPKKYKAANLTVRTGKDGQVAWGGIGRRSCQLPVQNYFWTDIKDKRIFYSLDTFFQANLSILPKLFEVIDGFPCWEEKPNLYDLYGGVGLFGIGLIDQVQKVVLIEENIASLAVARHNVDYNRLKNFEIIEGKVEDQLAALLASNVGEMNVAMIDPPRAGLSEKARRLFTEIEGLRYIMYLSCNPASLARDLKSLATKGWEIQTVTPFDFFPKTKHIETLVLLKFKGA